MARPPQRYEALRSLYTCLVILILVPFGVVAGIFVVPFTFLQCSANWGLRKRDFWPVQLYLDHFEALHPDLTRRVSTFLSSSAVAGPSSQHRPPKALKFWPKLRHDHNVGEIPSLAIIRLRRYTFSPAAGLFSYLEQSGFRRKDLYALLQREVESKIPEGSSLTAEDKANFQRIMKTVCEGSLTAMLTRSSSKDEGFILPISAGEKVISVQNRSVDWILEDPGALVVPMDMVTYVAMSNLTKALPVWKRVEDDSDLATGLDGKWQTVDLR